MFAKRLGLLALALVLSAGSGCCRWCERWCSPSQPTVVAAPTAVHAAQPCVPICCPAPVCCPTGTAPVVPGGTGWQKGPYGP